MEELARKLEPGRKSAMFLYIAACALMGIGFLMLIMLNFFGIFSLMASIPVLMFADSKGKEYKKQVKLALAVGVFKKHFDNVVFEPDKGFDREYLRNAEMLSLGTGYVSNDYLSAYHHGIHFQQADAEITQQSGRTTVTVFHGQYRIFEFKKNFTSYLQIRDKDEAILGNTKPYQFFTVRTEKVSKLKLENDKFNEVFNVYCSDDHEAFYILTPHFMEKLLELNTKLDCPLVVGFLDNKLHISTDTRHDLFEPSVWEKIDNKYVEKVEEEIAVIMEIVDILDLDR